MAGSLIVRPGEASDAKTVLDLWDAAIAWLVARNQTGQWGREPASARVSCREAVRDWASGTGLRIGELDGEPVGVSVVVKTCPIYVPPTKLSERYLLFLLVDRERAGQGIGAALIEHAAGEARAKGAQVLRVDCWAAAPDLVRWYERNGFVKSDTFTVNDDWPAKSSRCCCKTTTAYRSKHHSRDGAFGFRFACIAAMRRTIPTASLCRSAATARAVRSRRRRSRAPGRARQGDTRNRTTISTPESLRSR